jgi:subtilisin-like proprotein convertase family protein
MRRAVWLFSLLSACGFEDFDKFEADTADPAGSGSSGGVVDTGDSGLTGDGGGSGTGSDPCPDADADGVDTCSGDCDDSSASTFPGAAEKEDRPAACMKDSDGDGWGDANASGDVEAGRDCDDGDVTLTPEDNDADGVSSCAGDCDDNDPTRAPGNIEVPYDDIDSDCDGDDGGYGTTASGGGGSAYPINDYSMTTSTATIEACSSIYDLLVTVGISHTFIGDLEVTLRGPSGATALLHDRSGSSADDIFGTYGTSSGSLISAESMNVFIGESGAGTWTLEIYDNLSGDQGQLDSWSISLVCL